MALTTALSQGSEPGGRRVSESVTALRNELQAERRRSEQVDAMFRELFGGDGGGDGDGGGATSAPAALPNCYKCGGTKPPSPPRLGSRSRSPLRLAAPRPLDPSLRTLHHRPLHHPPHPSYASAGVAGSSSYSPPASSVPSPAAAAAGGAAVRFGSTSAASSPTASRRKSPTPPEPLPLRGPAAATSPRVLGGAPRYGLPAAAASPAGTEPQPDVSGDGDGSDGGDEVEVEVIVEEDDAGRAAGASSSSAPSDASDDEATRRSEVSTAAGPAGRAIRTPADAPLLPPRPLPAAAPAAVAAAAVEEQFGQVAALGPVARRMLAELRALHEGGSPLVAGLDAVREYASQRQMEEAAWQEGLEGAIVGQRFASPFLRSEDVLFAGDVVDACARATAGCVADEGGAQYLNLRGVLDGPKDCGKSTALHLFATRILLPQMRKGGSWETAFVVPVNWDAYLGEAVLDIGVVYCHLVQHFVDLLVVQRPRLRRWALQLASFWKKVVTQTRQPTLPPDVAAEHEGLAAAWGLHCGLLQRCFLGGHCDEFLSATLAIPEVLRASTGFNRVMWLVDGLETARASFGSNGRGGDVPPTATVAQHLHFALQRPASFFMIAGEEGSDDGEGELEPIEGELRIPLQGMIPRDTLAQQYPGLPSIVRCSGREYSVAVFGGFPGYLVPFIKLLEATATIKAGKGEGTQRSVEFYGSAVESLLERLTAMNGGKRGVEG